MQTPPSRILIVRPSALGDVCRTVPALVSLKRAFPGAAIDWVVNDGFVDAVRAHPDLSEAIPFPRGRFSGWWRSRRVSGELRGWFTALRERGYDLVIDLQGLSRSALITAMTRAPRRVGFSSAREMAWVGYNARHPRPESAHVVDQMLELLAHEDVTPVHDMRLYAPPDDVAWWNEHEARQEESRLVVFAPTSRWESKRWPVEHWRELVDPLVDRGAQRFAVIGAPGEREAIAGALADLTALYPERVIDLVGTLSLGRTMAVIASAPLVIASDSAPLHMAVGFDRPIIALFGPTDPAFVGPYRRDETVIRCYDAERDGRVSFRAARMDDSIMARITSRMVIERVDALYPGSALASKADSSEPAR